MDFKKRIAILVPIDVRTGCIDIKQLKSEYETTTDQDSTGSDPLLTDKADTESAGQISSNDSEKDTYLAREKMLMDLAIDKAIEEDIRIAAFNPHPTLSIAHHLVASLLSYKVVTSHLFRRHPIPSHNPPEPFPRNLASGQWTPWTSFTLSKSKEVQPGTLQCSMPMKEGDIEVLTVSNSKTVYLIKNLAGNGDLIKRMWEIPEGPRHVSPLLELMKPDFGLVEARGKRVIA
ncbi:hypothetical protein IL306_013056 [Fusarium sp. DS 682]|nr:hypothetical protein IL306_013056 [Fusarium sp. DS 682]